MPTQQEPPLVQPPIAITKTNHNLPIIITCIICGFLLIITAFVAWYIGKHQSTQSSTITPTPTTVVQNQPQTSATTAPTQAQGITLDTSKNYGNMYANGILPVGDNKYTTTTAQVGTVFVCSNNFVPAGQAGAQTRGPWFVNNNTEYDINKKVSVSGSVSWNPSISMNLTGTQRIISTNDLPNHKTGIFPIQVSDPAYQYDRNPNTITTQSLTYTLSANPTYSQTPHCIQGEVGVMLTGVALFDGFDAGGRDAGAWEVQDGCSGHPQESGEYHYHTLSSCITNTNVTTVIGFALDGFPITGPKLSTNNVLTTKDLDECHGITSQITLDGKSVTTYHYVMTQDFPYSASCFRSAPASAPHVQSQQQKGGMGQRMPPMQQP